MGNIDIYGNQLSFEALLELKLQEEDDEMQPTATLPQETGVYLLDMGKHGKTVLPDHHGYKMK